MAFVTEAEEWLLRDVGFDEDRWLPGLFLAHVEIERDGGADSGPEAGEPLPIAEAIAWALAQRPDSVVIRDGDERHFGLGAVVDEPPQEDEDPILPWRDELASQFVRRRPADERWKDRTPADPPIAWAVVAELAPETVAGEPWPLVEDPAGTDARAAAIIAGWAPESWSGEAVAAHRRDNRRARRRARLRWPFTRETAYFVRSCPGWLLRWTVRGVDCRAGARTPA